MIRESNQEIADMVVVFKLVHVDDRSTCEENPRIPRLLRDSREFDGGADGI